MPRCASARPGLVRGLLVLILACCGLAGPVRGRAPATLPVVRFLVESEAGREYAGLCGRIWADRGPRLAEFLLPPQAAPDTVTCLLLGTAAFQERFGTTLPDWGVGFALPSGRAIALDYGRVGAVGRGLGEVFLHEMTHALLFQAARDAWLPTWFHEGVALRCSGEWRFLDTVSLILDGHVPELGRLTGRFSGSAVRAERAYRTSLLAVSRLEDRFGPRVIAELVAATAERGDFTVAFQAVTGQSLGDFQRDFDSGMRLRYGWLFIFTRWPALFVLLSLGFVLGAARKLILARRRLQQMPEDGS